MKKCAIFLHFVLDKSEKMPIMYSIESEKRSQNNQNKEHRVKSIKANRQSHKDAHRRIAVRNLKRTSSS